MRGATAWNNAAALGAAMILVVACGDSRGGGDSDALSGSGAGVSISSPGVSVSAGGSLTSPTSPTSTGGGSGVSGGTDGASTSSGDGGIKLDLGLPPDGGLQDKVCKKVDVILAVDNSGTMQEEIDVLRGPVFDSLPEMLLAVGDGLDDFHLAVIDGCPKPPHYHNWGKDGACNFSTGGNYMVSSSPALAEEFSCVTYLTSAGYNGQLDTCVDAGDLKDDDEQPALAAADSVTPGAIVAANSGFLRDDAVLWVIAITDEDEEGYGPDAQGLAQQLIDAKGGDINDVVFLGVGGAQGCEGPYGSAQAANFLKQVTAQFEQADRGLFWDLCQGDLPAAFAATMPLVDAACVDFIPG